MTLRQLEYLVAVAQTGSFTEAALRLHVSQPTLSQQIRALEREVGAPLIERMSRGLRLTPAGKAMFGDAQAALASAHRALDNTRRAVASESQMVTLATVRSLAAAVLPSTVKRWHEIHPEVTVSMREFASRHEAADAVREGTAELGIGPLPDGWSGAHAEMGWEQLILVLPANDPLAGTSGDIRLETLANRDWVLYEDGHGLGDQAVTACHDAGFDPIGAVWTAQIEVAARLAAAGIGPALVPIRNVPPDLQQYVRAIDPPISWRVWAYGLSDDFSPTVKAFAAVLLEGPWQRQAIALPDPGAHSRASAASSVATSAAIS
jgi:DNA-binding transcriptional LysR family regulator